ncbi:MAG: hypothetical protein ACK56I_35160, partial [bacterium]
VLGSSQRSYGLDERNSRFEFCDAHSRTCRDQGRGFRPGRGSPCIGCLSTLKFGLAALHQTLDVGHIGGRHFVLLQRFHDVAISSLGSIGQVVANTLGFAEVFAHVVRSLCTVWIGVIEDFFSGEAALLRFA